MSAPATPRLTTTSASLMMPTNAPSSTAAGQATIGELGAGTLQRLSQLHTDGHPVLSLC